MWHDSQETRTGDVSYLGRRYAQRADPETPEAICASDADKLECMQGIEYKAQGHANAQRWIDNSRGRLVTGTARRLADQLLGQDPLDWLRAAMGEAES